MALGEIFWIERFGQRLVLRQIVGDLEPGCLVFDEHMHLRRDVRFAVENSHRDAQLRGRVRIERESLIARPARSVDHRRAAIAAEAAPEAGRGFIELDQLFTLQPFEMILMHPDAAAERRTMLLAAVGAVTIERLFHRPGDPERHTAAQAASGYIRHFDSLILFEGD